MNLFRIDDTVRIKKSGVIGTIADISGSGENRVYVIDTDSGDDDELMSGAVSPVLYCTENELEPV